MAIQYRLGTQLASNKLDPNRNYSQGDAAIDSFQGGLYSGAEAVGHLTNWDWLEEAAKAKQQANYAEAQRYTPKGPTDIRDIDSLSSGFEWAGDRIVENLPQLGTQIGAAALGGLVGGVPGAIASGAAVSIPTLLGETYQRQKEEGVVDKSKLVGSTIAKSAMELVPVGTGVNIARKLGFGTIGSAVKKQMLAEGIPEAGQGVATEWAAGINPSMDEEYLWDRANEFAAGTAVGTAAGAAAQGAGYLGRGAQALSNTPQHINELKDKGQETYDNFKEGREERQHQYGVMGKSIDPYFSMLYKKLEAGGPEALTDQEYKAIQEYLNDSGEVRTAGTPEYIQDDVTTDVGTYTPNNPNAQGYDWEDLRQRAEFEGIDALTDEEYQMLNGLKDPDFERLVGRTKAEFFMVEPDGELYPGEADDKAAMYEAINEREQKNDARIAAERQQKIRESNEEGIVDDTAEPTFMDVDSTHRQDTQPQPEHIFKPGQMEEVKRLVYAMVYSHMSPNDIDIVERMSPEAQYAIAKMAMDEEFKENDKNQDVEPLNNLGNLEYPKNFKELYDDPDFSYGTFTDENADAEAEPLSAYKYQKQNNITEARTEFREAKNDPDRQAALDAIQAFETGVFQNRFTPNIDQDTGEESGGDYQGIDLTEATNTRFMGTGLKNPKTDKRYDEVDYILSPTRTRGMQHNAHFRSKMAEQQDEIDALNVGSSNTYMQIPLSQALHEEEYRKFYQEKEKGEDTDVIDPTTGRADSTVNADTQFAKKLKSRTKDVATDIVSKLKNTKGKLVKALTAKLEAKDYDGVVDAFDAIGVYGKPKALQGDTNVFDLETRRKVETARKNSYGDSIGLNTIEHGYVPISEDKTDPYFSKANKTKRAKQNKLATASDTVLDFPNAVKRRAKQLVAGGGYDVDPKNFAELFNKNDPSIKELEREAISSVLGEYSERFAPELQNKTDAIDRIKFTMDNAELNLRDIAGKTEQKKDDNIERAKASIKSGKLNPAPLPFTVRALSHNYDSTTGKEFSKETAVFKEQADLTLEQLMDPLSNGMLPIKRRKENTTEVYPDGYLDLKNAINHAHAYNGRSTDKATRNLTKSDAARSVFKYFISSMNHDAIPSTGNKVTIKSLLAQGLPARTDWFDTGVQKAYGKEGETKKYPRSRTAEGLLQTNEKAKIDIDLKSLTKSLDIMYDDQIDLVDKQENETARIGEGGESDTLDDINRDLNMLNHKIQAAEDHMEEMTTLIESSKKEAANKKNSKQKLVKADDIILNGWQFKAANSWINNLRKVATGQRTFLTEGITEASIKKWADKYDVNMDNLEDYFTSLNLKDADKIELYYTELERKEVQKAISGKRGTPTKGAAQRYVAKLKGDTVKLTNQLKVLTKRGQNTTSEKVVASIQEQKDLLQFKIDKNDRIADTIKPDSLELIDTTYKSKIAELQASLSEQKSAKQKATNKAALEILNYLPPKLRVSNKTLTAKEKKAFKDRFGIDKKEITEQDELGFVMRFINNPYTARHEDDFRLLNKEDNNNRNVMLNRLMARINAKFRPEKAFSPMTKDDAIKKLQHYGIYSKPVNKTKTFKPKDVVSARDYYGKYATLVKRDKQGTTLKIEVPSLDQTDFNNLKALGILYKDRLEHANKVRDKAARIFEADRQNKINFNYALTAEEQTQKRKDIDYTYLDPREFQSQEQVELDPDQLQATFESKVIGEAYIDVPDGKGKLTRKKLPKANYKEEKENRERELSASKDNVPGATPAYGDTLSKNKLNTTTPYSPNSEGPIELKTLDRVNPPTKEEVKVILDKIKTRRTEVQAARTKFKKDNDYTNATKGYKDDNLAAKAEKGTSLTEQEKLVYEVVQLDRREANLDKAIKNFTEFLESVNESGPDTITKQTKQAKANNKPAAVTRNTPSTPAQASEKVLIKQIDSYIKAVSVAHRSGKHPTEAIGNLKRIQNALVSNNPAPNTDYITEFEKSPLLGSKPEEYVREDAIQDDIMTSAPSARRNVLMRESRARVKALGKIRRTIEDYNKLTRNIAQTKENNLAKKEKREATTAIVPDKDLFNPDAYNANAYQKTGLEELDAYAQLVSGLDLDSDLAALYNENNNEIDYANMEEGNYSPEDYGFEVPETDLKPESRVKTPPKSKRTKAEQWKYDSIIREHDTLLEAISRVGGLLTSDAMAQGIDPALKSTTGIGIRRVISNSGQTLDRLLETLNQEHFSFDTTNDLLDTIMTSLNLGTDYYGEGDIDARANDMVEEYEAQLRYQEASILAEEEFENKTKQGKPTTAAEDAFFAEEDDFYNKYGFSKNIANENLPTYELSNKNSAPNLLKQKDMQSMADSMLENTGLKVKILSYREALRIANKMGANREETILGMKTGALHGFAHSVKGKDGKYSVYVNPEMNDALRAEILAHELGHITMYGSGLHDKATNAEARGVLREFGKWLKDMGRPDVTYKELVASKKSPLAILEMLKLGAGDVRVSEFAADGQAYLKDFDEWYADEAGKALLQSLENKKPTNFIQRYFKKIINNLKRIYSELTGEAQSSYAVNHEVSKYVEGLRSKQGVTQQYNLDLDGSFDQGAFDKLSAKPDLAMSKSLGQQINTAMNSKFWNKFKTIVLDKDQNLRSMLTPEGKEISAFTKLANLFHKSRGDENSSEAYWDAKMFHMAKYDKRMADIMRNTTRDQQKIIMNELYDEKLSDGQVSGKTKAIRSLFKDLREYMESVGLKFNKRQNYFPEIADHEYVENHEQQFKAMMSKYSKEMQGIADKWNKDKAKQNRTLMRAPTKDADLLKAKDIPQVLYDSIVSNEGIYDEAMAGQQRPAVRALNHRIISFLDAEDRKNWTENYLQSSVTDATSSYIMHVVKRVEFEKRFGALSEAQRAEFEDKELDRMGIVIPTPEQREYVRARALQTNKFDALILDAHDEGATGNQIKRARDSFDAEMGIHGRRTAQWINEHLGIPMPPAYSPINKSVQLAMSTVMSVANLWVLGMSTLTSLADPLGIAVRTGSLTQAASALKAGIGASIGSNRNHLKALAETVGSITDTVTKESLAHGYNMAYMTPGVKRMNDWFFKTIGLEQWTKTTRLMAVHAAQGFIKMHDPDSPSGKKTLTKHSDRFYKELGLKKGDVTYVDGRIELLRYDDYKKATKEEQAKDDRVKAAISEFVDTSILRPNPSNRPLWASDPHFILAFHLKSFMYAFQKTILNPLVHEAKNGNFMPLLAITSYIPTMVAVGIIKDVFKTLGDDDDDFTPSFKENWDTADYLWDGWYKGGMNGIAQPIFDIARDRKYGKSGLGALVSPGLDLDTFSTPPVPLNYIWRNITKE